MSSRQHSMASFALQQLRTLAATDFEQQPAMQLRKRLLERLREVRPVGLTDRALELAVCRMQMQFSEPLSEALLEELAQETAQALRAVYRGLRGLSLTHQDEVFIDMASSFELKF